MKKFLEIPIVRFLLPFLILYLLVQFFFMDVVFFDHNFFWRDLLSHSYPAKKIFVDAITAGELPLWNPYVSLGLPYLADLSNQPLYIFNLFFLICAPNVAMNLTVILHYVLCAFFMFLFVRNLTQNAYIGVFSSIAFTFSGYCLSLSCNIEYLSAIAWVPAVFWSFYQAKDTRKPIYFILCGIFFSLLIYGGEPMAYYFLAGFLLLRCLFELKDKKNFKITLVSFVIVILVSIIYSAVQLLPAMELVSHSVRSGGLSFSEATIWSMNPFRLLEFYLPFYFGNNFPVPQYWGVFMQLNTFDVPWAEGLYFGAIPFMLALCSLYYSRTREKIFWACVVVIALIISFGAYTPIYKILFDYVPMFDSFRYPEKLILFVTLGFCVLAAFGLKDLIEFKPKSCERTWFLIFIMFVVLLVAVNYDIGEVFDIYDMEVSGEVTREFIADNIRFRIMYFFILALVLIFSSRLLCKNTSSINKFLVLIIAITFIDILYINSNSFITSKIDFYDHKVKIVSIIKEDWKQNYPPRVFCSQNLSKFLPHENNGFSHKELMDNFYNFFNIYWLENLIPNRGIIYDLALVRTVSSLKLANVKAIEESLYVNDLARYFEFLNIDYIIASPIDSSFYRPYSSVMYYNTFNILMKPRRRIPRTFMVSSSENVSNIKEIQNKLLDPFFNIRKKVLVNTPDALNTFKGDNGYSAKIIKYSNNDVIIETKSNSSNYLVLLDAYYPGWKAFVDGNDEEIIVVDGIYRAVKISEGNHIVKFSFKPKTYQNGLIVTFAGLLLSLIILLVSGYGSKKQDTPD